MTVENFAQVVPVSRIIRLIVLVRFYSVPFVTYDAQKKVKEYFEPMKTNAYQAWKEICAFVN
jgi:hypothetical protein